MEAVWQIVALGLLGAVLAALLKKHTPELALLLAVAVCGAAALAAVRGVREVWAFLEDLLAAVEISSTLFLPLLKTAGICRGDPHRRRSVPGCRGERRGLGGGDGRGHGGAAGGAAPDAGSVGGAAVAAVRAVWLMCLLLLAMVPAWAADLPQEVTDAAPPAAEELEGKDFSGGIAALLEQGTTLLGEALRGNLRGAVLILGVVLLCGAADAVLRTPESPMRRFLPMAGAGGHCGAVAGQHEEPAGAGDPDHRGIGRVLQGAAADAGRRCGRRRGRCYRRNGTGHRRVLCRCPHYPHPGTAAAYDVLFGGGGHGGCHAAPARLGTVAKAASRVVTWLLTGSLVLFTGYLTLSGAVSTSADALTVQVTRSAVGAMPVVGRILSDAAGSVLAGAGVVKNAIGVFGLLGVLAACLGPFVRLGVQYLLYKLTAFLAGMTAAPELAKLIDALGGVFGLMLGMTGSCALLLLISISSAILVVTP